MTGCSSTGCCKSVASPRRLMLPPERFLRRRSASICNNLRSNSLRALEKQEEKSALKDNAIKNKEIEEATKSNIGDLIKAEMKDSDAEDEQV